MKSNVCCVVLVCLLVAPAHGQTPQAIDCEANAACVALAEQAQKQSKAGQLAEAEKSYKMAYEVSHDASLLYPIARVLDKRGQGPEAMKYYRQFIEAPVEDQEQKEKARGYLAQLEATLAPRQLPPLVPAARATTPSITPAPPQLVAPPTTEGKDTPVYKKGWFWGLMVGSVAAVGLGIGLGIGLSSRGATVPSGTNTAEPTF